MTTRPYYLNTFSRNKVAKDGVGVVDDIIIVERQRAGVTQHNKSERTEPRNTISRWLLGVVCVCDEL